MSKIIGMPDLNIIFTGLGATAVQRGEKGQAILIVKDEKDGDPVTTLSSIDAFDDEVQKSFSEENVVAIKDVLKGTPKELKVIRVSTGDTGDDEGDNPIDDIFRPTSVAGAFKLVNTVADRNCWIAIADAEKDEDEDLVSFVKSQNKFQKKKYKALVFQADNPDDMHIVNFTTDQIKYKDEDEIYSGKKFIPRMLGAIAGQSLDMSLITQRFDELELVTEPEDMDEAVDNGELFLHNDEGKITVGRAVNSLVTTGEGITNDMRFILIVEIMDLIYVDIYNTWKDSYMGKYKNILDNQMLLVSAINAYLEQLQQDVLLDPNFENTCRIDAYAQKLANYPIYGEEEVDSWSEERVLSMTVGTQVFLEASIKIPNTMEDIDFKIYM